MSGKDDLNVVAKMNMFDESQLICPSFHLGSGIYFTEAGDWYTMKRGVSCGQPGFGGVKKISLDMKLFD